MANLIQIYTHHLKGNQLLQFLYNPVNNIVKINHLGKKNSIIHRPSVQGASLLKDQDAVK